MHVGAPNIVTNPSTGLTSVIQSVPHDHTPTALPPGNATTSLEHHYLYCVLVELTNVQDSNPTEAGCVHQDALQRRCETRNISDYCI